MRKMGTSAAAKIYSAKGTAPYIGEKCSSIKIFHGELFLYKIPAGRIWAEARQHATTSDEKTVPHKVHYGHTHTHMPHFLPKSKSKKARMGNKLFLGSHSPTHIHPVPI